MYRSQVLNAKELLSRTGAIAG